MRSPSWMELSLPVAALLLALALSLAWLFLLGRANDAIGLIGSINGSGSLHRSTEWEQCRQDRGEGGGADRVRACVSECFTCSSASRLAGQQRKKVSNKEEPVWTSSGLVLLCCGPWVAAPQETCTGWLDAEGGG